MTQHEEFKQSVQRDSERQKKGEQQRAGFFGLLFYGGILGLLLVIPIVGGAYLGRWLDSLNQSFGTRWTVSLIVLGVAAGIWNIFWYLRGKI
jgi:ATP synthase protein I